MMDFSSKGYPCILYADMWGGGIIYGYGIPPKAEKTADATGDSQRAAGQGAECRPFADQPLAESRLR